MMQWIGAAAFWWGVASLWFEGPKVLDGRSQSQGKQAPSDEAKARAG